MSEAEGVALTCFPQVFINARERQHIRNRSRFSDAFSEIMCSMLSHRRRRFFIFYIFFLDTFRCCLLAQMHCGVCDTLSVCVCVFHLQFGKGLIGFFTHRQIFHIGLDVIKKFVPAKQNRHFMWFAFLSCSLSLSIPQTFCL